VVYDSDSNANTPTIYIDDLSVPYTQTATAVKTTHRTSNSHLTVGHINQVGNSSTRDGFSLGFIFDILLKNTGEAINAVHRMAYGEMDLYPNTLLLSGTLGEVPGLATDSVDSCLGRVIRHTTASNGTITMLIETDIDSETNTRDLRYWTGANFPSGIQLISQVETTPAGDFIFKWRRLVDIFTKYEISIEKEGVSFITDADITDVGIINSIVKSLTLAESNDYTWKVRGWTGSAWGDWSYSVGFRYLQDSDDPGASSGISDVRWVDGSYDDAYGTQYNRFTSTNTAGFTATELFENFEIRKGSESNRAFPKRLPGNTTTPKDYDFSVVGSNQFFVRGEQSADSVLTDWFPSDTKQSHPGAPDAPSYYEGAPTHIFNSGWVNPTGGSPSHWRDDGQFIYNRQNSCKVCRNSLSKAV